MELSGLEVLLLTKEINSRLRGTYVNNVYSLGRAQVISFRKPGEGDSWLVASPGLGVWPSERVSARAETTGFTTKLRGELERARFVGAEQPDLDRVFDIVLGEGESRRHLIIEMMPPGNVIVTDGAGRILVAQMEVRTPSRKVTRGATYAPPSQRRPSPRSVSAAALAEAIRSEKTAGRAIGRHVALPGKYVGELLQRLSLKDDSSSESLRGREEEILGELSRLIEDAYERPAPCICETPSGPEIFAIMPTAFPVKVIGQTLGELCDLELLKMAVEGVKTSEDPLEARRKEMEVTVSRLIAQQASLKEEGGKMSELAKRAGAANSLEEAIMILNEGGIRARQIPNSQAAAASMLYDRKKELERKAGDAKEAADDLLKRMERLKPSAKSQLKELRKQSGEWYEKFRWFVTSGGRLAIGGRDAQSNSTLIRRHLEPNDTVYHADLFGSPFFVLKGGKDQSEVEVGEVAQATASFSSAWKTGLGSADAYWVSPDQVGKSAPSGEYLPRGSFLIRGKKNFVTRNLVELAVGVDSHGRVMSGPEGALASRVLGYVIVRPHREKTSDSGKRVKKDLETISGGVLRSSLRLDDVVRALPAGGAKVVRRRVMDPP